MPPETLLESAAGTLGDTAASRPVSTEAVRGRGWVAELAFPVAFAGIAAGLALLVVGILRINNGTFVYTLDDPYIHLALSDQIRHGNYGLYPGTHAAPSSSILFPFVLAIAAGTALHPFLPLLFNICALFFTMEVMRRFLLHLDLGRDSFAAVVQAGAVALMLFCFNVVGVVFTGLEHSLHIATVVAIVYGLVLFLDRDKVPAWLPAAIVLCPLVRYEGMALGLAALCVLAMRGRVRIALATFGVFLLSLGGFSVFLMELGLPPLPSSVLTKSAIPAGGGGVAHEPMLVILKKNINFMTTHSSGVVLLLIAVMAATMTIGDLATVPRRLASRRMMSFVLLSLIGGQAVAGRFGWLERYEDYLMLATALICIYLAKSTIREALAPPNGDRLLLALAGAASLLIVGARYWEMTLKIPLASNNIYEQQLQMHRFVDGYYREPVAVNDLGLVSYRNPYPVLDLGGLGSEKARSMIASHATASDYEAFVAANGVHLVIVYQEWFTGRIPETWQRVGTLSLSRERISAAQGEVNFYVTDEPTAVAVRRELRDFKATLPSRVELTVE